MESLFYRTENAVGSGHRTMGGRFVYRLSRLALIITSGSDGCVHEWMYVKQQQQQSAIVLEILFVDTATSSTSSSTPVCLIVFISAVGRFVDSKRLPSPFVTRRTKHYN